jgi:DNA mismatch repair protein MutS2
LPNERINKNKPQVTNEIHLRQLTVDEALLKLDEYLDDAFMAGIFSVRVIHGKGAGILRQAVREYLSKHSLVKSFRPGAYGEGGDGVTIVELVHR